MIRIGRDPTAQEEENKKGGDWVPTVSNPVVNPEPHIITSRLVTFSSSESYLPLSWGRQVYVAVYHTTEYQQLYLYMFAIVMEK